MLGLYCPGTYWVKKSFSLNQAGEDFNPAMNKFMKHKLKLMPEQLRIALKYTFQLCLHDAAACTQ